MAIGLSGRRSVRLCVACGVTLVVTGCGSADREGAPTTGPSWTDYVGAIGSAMRAELLRPSPNCQRSERDPVWIEAAERMGERDRLARSGEVSDQRWRELDAENRSELAELIDKRGWPEPCQLTRSAASALFYVIQHHRADQVRQEALPLFEEMGREGLVRGSEVAMLVDRTLIDQGAAQRFGTQYECRDGIWARMPTEAPETLNARRDEMGLIPADIEARLVNRDLEESGCSNR